MTLVLFQALFFSTVSYGSSHKTQPKKKKYKFNFLKTEKKKKKPT